MSVAPPDHLVQSVWWNLPSKTPLSNSAPDFSSSRNCSIVRKL